MLIDLLAKAAVVRWLVAPIDVAGILTLRVTHNTGVAFSLGANQHPRIVLVVTTVAVIALAVAAFRGLFDQPIPAGLILGGGLANLIDRVHGGTVTDLVDLGWWPVFNPADAFITLGAAWLIVSSLSDRGEDSSRDPADDRESERERA